MTSAAFSTPENASLDRKVDYDQDLVNFEYIWTEKNRLLCKNWVNKNQFKKVGKFYMKKKSRILLIVKKILN